MFPWMNIRSKQTFPEMFFEDMPAKKYAFCYQGLSYNRAVYWCGFVGLMFALCPGDLPAWQM